MSPRALDTLIWRLLYNARLEPRGRGMLPLLVIIYSYNFVQRDLPPLFCAADRARDGAGRSARKRESMCRGTRVCQCLPVSTPTYLCKSFNLTPPACRANPERDRISKPIRIHCLDGGETRCAAPRRSTHSSHTIAFLLSATADRVYIDVKSAPRVRYARRCA